MDDLGHIEFRNVLILFTIWLLVYYCCIRGIRSIAKVIYITATFPFGLMVILLTRGLTLPGYESGIKFYTQPDWTKLTDLNIWASATTQAIFSTGIAYGSHIAMANYNRFNNNILRDAFLIGFINTITSILGGFIIFAFFGHASYKLGKPIEDIFEEGPGILFISYVQGMTLLPGSAVWSFLFFMMAFTLGLDSQFVMVWTVFAALQDKFPLFFKRFKAFALIGICVLQFLLGLPLVTQGGIHMVVLIDRYTADFTVTLFIVLESVSVCWVYGINNFIEDVEMMIGKKSRIFWIYWKVTWVVTTPLFCVFIFLASAVGYTKSSYDGKKIPGSGEAIGLILITTPTLLFLGVIILQIYRYKGVKPVMKPSLDWQPRYIENRTGRYGQSQPIGDNYITATVINEACEDPPPPVCNRPVDTTTQL